MSELKTGYAKVDITPFMGTTLAGYPYIRYADGVLDPLYAIAVAFENGGKKAVLISVDNLGLPLPIQNGYREAIAQRIGTDKEAVYITCTHTHLAPHTASTENGTTEPEYCQFLGQKLSDAAWLAGKIAKAFQAKYVKKGVVDNGSQSAQSIALYLGLVPASEVAAAEARLLKAIEEKGNAPSTGIFSTRYMLMYLSEHGRRDVAEKIVLHKGFPGWLHMLERGATTLWETWKESDDVYSNCHPMFGSVDEWILKYGAK